MVSNQKFYGTGVAIVTPFAKDESVDYNAFGKLIDFQIENKVDYIVLLGTTGETATLSKEEKKDLLSFTKQKINKRVPLVVGFGGNNTKEVLDNIKTADLNGIDAILSVCPYYNKPSQKGIYEHYKAIATNSDLPLIIYNVPGRTGVSISADTTLALANDFKNIIATKEASANFDQIMKIIKDKPENFLVISGDDALTFPLIALGASGVISVVANAVPKLFAEMVREALAGKYNEARIKHYKTVDFIASLFAEGSPGGIKAALNHKELIENVVRLPLVTVSETHYKKVIDLLEKTEK